MRAAKIAIVCVVILLAPTMAWAQGAIVGLVKDTTGAVLPGVTVEAASPALIEKLRTGVTDSTGQFRIENLTPGTYSVTYTLPGFSTVKREGIELTGSFTATVNAELRVGSLEETITVTGQTPTVDVQSTTRQQSMSHDVIDLIPSGRGGTGAVNNLGLLIPGVVQGTANFQDVGGTTTVAQPVTFRAHGSDAQDQIYTQNGVSTGDSLASGYFSRLAVNVAATKETTFDTAAVNAELATGGVRVNIIPKDGGNRLEGTMFASFANGSMQSNNLTKELEDRGLHGAPTLKKVWDLNPGVGGPVKQDKLWFYLSGMYNGNVNYAAGIYHNLNFNKPDVWTYAPDLSRQATNDQRWHDGQGRLTWQATQKNRLGLTWHEQTLCDCPADIGGQTLVSPEGAQVRTYPVQRQIQGDWLAPVTNRLLVEAGFLRYQGISYNKPVPGMDPRMIGVTEQTTGMRYRTADFTYRTNPFAANHVRGTLSYLAAGHALKVGFNHTNGWSDNTTTVVNPVTYRLNNGVPNQITVTAYPYTYSANIAHSLGIFAQDRWTVGRLTASYGVRYDWFKSAYPEQHLGPTLLTPRRNVTFPAQDGVSLHDITPKLGAAYDLFGNGKTALKVTMNKYLQGLGTNLISSAVNPVNTLVLTTTRNWTDANRDYIPNCDLTLPAANGECGANAAADFGTNRPGAAFAPDILTGWGKRFYNWEFSTGVQHELLPRVSVDVGYFRRWYGNFLVTDNTLVGPSDYTRFNIQAPSDPRLPGGGGYTVTGLVDLNPNKVGQVANLVTFGKNYGDMSRRWDGVDVSFNVRPRNGMTVQGSYSTGREVSDWCDVAGQLPEIAFGQSTLTFIGALPTIGYAGGAGVMTPAQFCQQSTGYQKQVKLLGSYTIPKIDVLLGATFQSVDGPVIQAQYVATNAIVSPSLGRPLSAGAANVPVNILNPAGIYGDRSNTLNLRFGKVVRLSKTRTLVSLDLFNAMNSNAVIRQNNNYASWLVPQNILGPRLLKVSAQFDF